LIFSIGKLKEERFMESASQPAPVSTKMLWAGRIVSALPALLLVFSAVMKMIKPASVLEGFVRLGYPESLILPIAGLELVCAVVYVVPRTAMLGAILLTGYLGGATATLVRVGEPFYGPVVAGVLVWGGLFLRDPRLRALIPFRCEAA